MERYRFILDSLLDKNKKLPRKQRMTGRKIHQILANDYGFTGSVSTVRRYVAAVVVNSK